MPQLVLPIFPKDLSHINPSLGFCLRDGNVCYFYGSGFDPIFVHEEKDNKTFRMIVSQFYVTGKATQAQICRAFAIHPRTLKRSVKLYREKGPAGFYEPIIRRRGPAVLTDEVIANVENLLDQGGSTKEIAEKLEIKYDTLHKAIKAGKIKKKYF